MSKKTINIFIIITFIFSPFSSILAEDVKEIIQTSVEEAAIINPVEIEEVVAAEKVKIPEKEPDLDATATQACSDYQSEFGLTPCP